MREKLKRQTGEDNYLPPRILRYLQDLAATCYQAGLGNGSLGPAEEEDIDYLEGLPASYPFFPIYAAFLRHIAAGQLVPIPVGLPDELREWLEGMMKAPL
jgi:hypothetical protein